MKILHLTIKKKWFDMISSGEKKEEYRELSMYWRNRLHGPSRSGTGRNSDSFKHFDVVHFVNGGNFHVSHPSISLICKGVDIKQGKPEWGAEPGKLYFVIKLGEIIP